MTIINYINRQLRTVLLSLIPLMNYILFIYTNEHKTYYAVHYFNFISIGSSSYNNL